MEKTAQLPNRYKLYVGGTLYLSACSVVLGYIAGMWGVPMMSVSAAVMLVGGGVLLESFRRKTSVKKVKKRVENLVDQQDEVIKDLEQMRLYVSATGEAPQVKVKQTSATDSIDSKKSPRVSPAISAQDDIIQYSDAVTEELILTAIENASVDVFMQPVVTLPQRRMAMLEVFARLRAGNGQSLSASQYMNIAKERNLQIRLDNLLLKQGLDVIKKDVSRSVSLSYMMNIEGGTLRDVPFMNDLVRFLKSNPRMATRLIFEVKQVDLMGMKRDCLSVLEALSELGCGVSMDQVNDPHIDRDLMRQIGVRYIKISGERLKDFASSHSGVEVMRRIKDSLSGDGVSIVADKIEDERTLCEILDLEIDYGQGFLFGKPDRERVYDSYKTRKRA